MKDQVAVMRAFVLPVWLKMLIFFLRWVKSVHVALCTVVMIPKLLTEWCVIESLDQTCSIVWLLVTSVSQTVWPAVGILGLKPAVITSQLCSLYYLSSLCHGEASSTQRRACKGIWDGSHQETAIYVGNLPRDCSFALMLTHGTNAKAALSSTKLPEAASPALAEGFMDVFNFWFGKEQCNLIHPEEIAISVAFCATICHCFQMRVKLLPVLVWNSKVCRVLSLCCP